MREVLVIACEDLNRYFLLVYEPCSLKMGLKAFAQKFGLGHPARFAQDGLDRIFLLLIYTEQK